MTRLLAGLGLLLFLGCGAPSQEPATTLVLDLVRDLDLAEVMTETGLIDIGTQAGRAFLSQGWSWNEHGKSGSTFAWGSRYSSEINFYVAHPRPLRVQFRCHPIRRETGSVEAVRFRINDIPVGEVALRRGWKEYEITLPSASIRTGMNQIVLDYGWAEGPPAVERERGGRQVAVAWDWIRFPEMPPSSKPSVTDTGVLHLPPATRLDFYFDAPGETRLVVDQIKPFGKDGLEIFVLQDGEEDGDSSGAGSRLLDEFDGVASTSREGLSGQLTESTGLVRLRLQTYGEVELSRPRVLAVGPPEEPHQAESAGMAPPIPRARPGLVLLYVIDTLRADHLGLYDYGRNTSPGLDRLMADAVVFDNAVAQSSWTKPSTASILTGHLPWSHGAQKSEDALSLETGSMAIHLQDSGFATGAFSANGNISQVFGFHHGFDHFSLMGRFDAPATAVQAEALAWLADQDTTQGVFLYAHTIDPHAPYFPTQRLSARTGSTPPVELVGTVPFMRRLAKNRGEPDPALVQELIDMYDEEIRANDQQLAGLIADLKDRGLYDQSLILLVSDHGEEFYDHGSWTHGRTLHKEVLHVPLLIKFPHNWAAGKRVAETVQQIDLLPTVLDYLALPRPAELPGRSLLCSIQQTGSQAGLQCDTDQLRPSFSSVHYHHNHWVGVTLGDWKLILRGSSQLDRQARLFRRDLDPDEQQNLAAQNPVRVGYLSALIRAEMNNRSVTANSMHVELDAETRQRLEALGYLD